MKPGIRYHSLLHSTGYGDAGMAYIRALASHGYPVVGSCGAVSRRASIVVGHSGKNPDGHHALCQC